MWLELIMSLWLQNILTWLGNDDAWHYDLSFWALLLSWMFCLQSIWMSTNKQPRSQHWCLVMIRIEPWDDNFHVACLPINQNYLSTKTHNQEFSIDFGMTMCLYVKCLPINQHCICDWNSGCPFVCVWLACHEVSIDVLMLAMIETWDDNVSCMWHACLSTKEPITTNTQPIHQHWYPDHDNVRILGW